MTGSHYATGNNFYDSGSQYYPEPMPHQDSPPKPRLVQKPAIYPEQLYVHPEEDYYQVRLPSPPAMPQQMPRYTNREFGCQVEQAPSEAKFLRPSASQANSRLQRSEVKTYQTHSTNTTQKNFELSQQLLYRPRKPQGRFANTPGNYSASGKKL